MKTLSRQITSSTLVVAGTLAALGFGVVAQAAIISGDIGSITGPITPNPITGPNSPTSPLGQTFVFGTSTEIDVATGTFAGIPQSAVTFLKPLALTRVGNGPDYSFGPVTNFFSIASSFGPLLVSIPGGTVGRTGSGSPVFRFNGASGSNDLPALFGVAGGKVPGTLTDFTFGRLGTNSYAFGIHLPPAVVPEPSAALGLLGVAGVGLLSRRRKA